jgi:outer membrane protein OmpA-like peptidoglycan-associated protein
MGNSPAFLACRKCDSTQLYEYRICSVCGPVNGLYKGNPSSDGNPVEIICDECHQGIEAKGSVKLPHSCLYCGSTDLDWRELSTHRWVQAPHEVDSDPSDIWITGDFDGNYSGSLRGDSGGQLDQSQQFSILINNGKLYNPKRVKGPPLKRHTSEVKPLFQGEVDQVQICEGEPNSHSVKTLYIGQLDDFRLHEWSNLSEEVDRGKVESLIGCISGTAYAKLKSPQDIQKTEPENHGSSTTPPAPPSSEQPLAQNTFRKIWNKVVQLAKESSQSMVSGSQQPVADPELPPVQACKKCHWLLTCLVFILVWVACSLMHAVIAIAPLIVICYLVNALTKDFAPSLHWSDRISNWVSGLFILAALAILIFFAIPEISRQECATNFPWWLWSIALILIFTSILKRCWPWFLMVIIWVFVILINYSGPCFSHVSTGKISEKAPIAQVVKKDPSDADKTKKTVDQPKKEEPKNQETGPSKTQEILDNIQRITDRVVKNIDDNIKNVISSDEDGNLVVNSSKTKRADLDMAVNNPDKYFSCPNGARKVDVYDIYIGGAALFPFNDDQLSPDAKIYLDKLRQLMVLRPDAKIILTGNSDITGSEDVKFQKSLGRANALANWLVENNVTTMDKIQVKGASDLNLYVQNPKPEMQALNRRVDLRIDCPAAR